MIIICMHCQSSLDETSHHRHICRGRISTLQREQKTQGGRPAMTDFEDQLLDPVPGFSKMVPPPLPPLVDEDDGLTLAEMYRDLPV